MSNVSSLGGKVEELSPNAHREFQRSLMAKSRLEGLKTQIVPWSIAFVLISVETLALKSSVGIFLLNGFIPMLAISCIEFALFAYFLTMIVWMITDLGWFRRKTAVNNAKPVSTPAKRSEAQSSPFDESWVDGHQFGSPARIGRGESLRNSPTNLQRSPQSLSHSFNGSLLNSSVMDTSGILESSFNMGNKIQFIPQRSPHNKIMDSIHTREQLDRILRNKGQNFGNGNSSFSSSATTSQYFQTDLLGSESRPYQLSPEIKVTDGKENTEMISYGSGSSIRLSLAGTTAANDDEFSWLKTTMQQGKNSPKKVVTAGMSNRRDSLSERRRRSPSSPDRQSSPLASVSEMHEQIISTHQLEESDLWKGEQRLRAWLVNTMLAPLTKHIDKLNIILEKEHANPPLRIGSSSVDALRAALIARESLRSTALYFILPYLSIHTNQTYLVQRLRDLSSDLFMRDYKWNEGGSEIVDDKKYVSSSSVAYGPLSPRAGRRPWGEHLPTDAQLVFNCFCAYMDAQLTSNPLNTSSTVDQPFTSMYTLRFPTKPSAVHSTPGSFYMHLSSLQPPHWEFVHTDATSGPIRTTIAKGPSNLFRTILHFLHYAKTENHNRCDVVNLGQTGVNISCVLE